MSVASGGEFVVGDFAARAAIDAIDVAGDHEFVNYFANGGRRACADLAHKLGSGGAMMIGEELKDASGR